MATVTVKTEDIKVETVVKQQVVTLKLTSDEARTLMAVLSQIGGDPDKSARKHCDSIRFGLQSHISYDNYYGSHFASGTRLMFNKPISQDIKVF